MLIVIVFSVYLALYLNNKGILSRKIGYILMNHNLVFNKRWKNQYLIGEIWALQWRDGSKYIWSQDLS